MRTLCTSLTSRRCRKVSKTPSGRPPMRLGGRTRTVSGFSGQHFPHTVALRKSSRLLSPAQAPSSAHASSSSSGSSLTMLDCMQALCHSSQDGNPMFQMLACLAQLGQGMASANSPQQAVPLQGLQIFDDPRKKGAIAAPPTNTPAAASSPSGKDGTPTKEESQSQANSPPSEKKDSQSPSKLRSRPRS